jgi:hypothetical protein
MSEIVDKKRISDDSDSDEEEKKEDESVETLNNSVDNNAANTNVDLPIVTKLNNFNIDNDSLRDKETFKVIRGEDSYIVIKGKITDFEIMQGGKKSKTHKRKRKHRRANRKTHGRKK